MKISKETIDVISSFSIINPSILIKEGSVLSTKNEESTILARAEVKDEFPVQMGIYNLKQFLGVIDTFKAPEFVFDESKNYTIIKEGKQSIKYGFANPDLFVVPKSDDLPWKEEHLSFILDVETVRKIKKVSAALGVNDLVLESAKTYTTLTVCDSKDKSSNQFKIEIDKEADEAFKFVLNLKYFNIIEIDYAAKVVSVGSGDSKKYIFFLEGEYQGTKMKYFIAFDS